MDQTVKEPGSLCGQKWNKHFPESLANFRSHTEYKNENEDINRAKKDTKTKVLGLIRRGYVRI
jgi:hypothetical protein